jgi:hypothetical protein
VKHLHDPVDKMVKLPKLMILNVLKNLVRAMMRRASRPFELAVAGHPPVDAVVVAVPAVVVVEPAVVVVEPAVVVVVVEPAVVVVVVVPAVVVVGAVVVIVS